MRGRCVGDKGVQSYLLWIGCRATLQFFSLKHIHVDLTEYSGFVVPSYRK